jgi:hypothetical protein
VASTIRVKSIDTVYNGWAKVKRAVIDYRRRDGRWEEQTRELYDRGDGATIILFDPRVARSSWCGSSASWPMQGAWMPI